MLPLRMQRESPAVITVPLMILAALAILGGALNLPGLHSLTFWLEHSIAGIEAGQFNLLVAGISTVLALVAILLSWFLYGRHPLADGQPDPLKKILGPIFTIFERKYWVDEAYWTVFLTATSTFPASWRTWSTVVSGMTGSTRRSLPVLTTGFPASSWICA